MGRPKKEDKLITVKYYDHAFEKYNKLRQKLHLNHTDFMLHLLKFYESNNDDRPQKDTTMTPIKFNSRNIRNASTPHGKAATRTGNSTTPGFGSLISQ